MMHTSKLLSRGCNFYTYINNQKDVCLYTQKSSDLSFRLYKGLDHKLKTYIWSSVDIPIIYTLI